MEIEPTRGCQISFVRDDSMRDLLGFKRKVIHDEYKIPDYPLDILKFLSIFLKTDNAQRKIFIGKRSGLINNFTMDINSGY